MPLARSGVCGVSFSATGRGNTGRSPPATAARGPTARRCRLRTAPAHWRFGALRGRVAGGLRRGGVPRRRGSCVGDFARPFPVTRRRRRSRFPSKSARLARTPADDPESPRPPATGYHNAATIHPAPAAARSQAPFPPHIAANRAVAGAGFTHRLIGGGVGKTNQPAAKSAPRRARRIRRAHRNSHQPPPTTARPRIMPSCPLQTTHPSSSPTRLLHALPGHADFMRLFVGDFDHLLRQALRHQFVGMVLAEQAAVCLAHFG